MDAVFLMTSPTADLVVSKALECACDDDAIACDIMRASRRAELCHESRERRGRSGRDGGTSGKGINGEEG